MWCPVREGAPYPPTDLPFEPIRENIPRLNKQIVNNCRLSAFNQCTCEALPVVDSSPPLNLLVDPSVKPTAIHKPVQVQLHFIDEVRERLEKDV